MKPFSTLGGKRVKPEKLTVMKVEKTKEANKHTGWKSTQTKCWTPSHKLFPQQLHTASACKEK